MSDFAPLPLPADDLVCVVAQAHAAWPLLRKARIFLTGGSGFFGRWLLESLMVANDQLSLGVTVGVLTRSPEAFERRLPFLAARSALRLQKGDLASLCDAPVQPYDVVLHLATESDNQATLASPEAAVAVIAEGTAQALAYARRAGAKRFLFTSSGSVYDRTGTEGAVDELAPAPDQAGGRSGAYAISGVAKRRAEQACLSSPSGGMGVSIARCFTFLGPGLPLNGKFAAGNFIRDGLSQRTVQVGGDGTAVRSYLYMSDLAAWLWLLAAKGPSGMIFNVGADQAVSIAGLAQAVAKATGRPGDVIIARAPISGNAVDYYVPDIRKIVAEMGLSPTVDLDAAILKTIAWCRQSA